MDSIPRQDGAQDDLSQYVLLLLSDSNLPTGGFITSAGLESYVVHGLLSQCAQELHAGQDEHTAAGFSSSTSQAQSCSAFLGFVGSSLDSYAQMSMPFLADAHRLTADLRSSPAQESNGSQLNVDGVDAPKQGQVDAFVDRFSKLDDAYHSMVLNHVARRASCAQGIAFLTLFSKAFAREPELASSVHSAIRSRRPSAGPSSSPPLKRNVPNSALIPLALDALKLQIRHGQTQGHLPTCFGVFTATLGLDLRRSAHLHLFMQARALLSTAIRLNLFGPYLAHQMLLSHIRTLVDATLAGLGLDTDVDSRDGTPSGVSLTTGLLRPAHTGTGARPDGPLLKSRSSLRTSDEPVRDDDPTQGWAWDWADEGEWGRHVSLSHAPTTTWPLGEIAQARHDQLQSRLFNS